MLFCYYLLLAGGVGVVSGFTPVTYPVFSECGQYDHLQDEQLMETLSQVKQQLGPTYPVFSECGHYDHLQDEQLMETLSQVQQQLGPPGCNPSKNRSCLEILHCFPSAPSGYYQITAPMQWLTSAGLL